MRTARMRGVYPAVIIVLAGCCICLSTLVCGEAIASRYDEISLFNWEGNPVAYIAVSEDYTVYLWSGEPVAYLYRTGDDIHIYRFDGGHLAWLEDGIIWDHEGNAVGFVEGAINKATRFEPFKGLKKLKPLKGLRSLAPLKPLFSYYWSKIPLELYLLP